MNDKELDRLFRQKLEPMEVRPSAGAWEQLEAGLQHKKKKRLWVYISQIAAAILLLLGSWGAFEYSQQFVPTEQLTKGKDNSDSRSTSAPVQLEVAQSKTIEESALPEPISETVAEAAKTAVPPKAPAEKAERTRNSTPVRAKENTQLLASAPVPTSKNQTAGTTVPTVESKPLQTQALSGTLAQEGISEALPMKEKVIISYSADDEEPMTTTALAAVDTAPEKDKEISARKIIGFFKKVTDTSGAGLAELREAKNELLSLNRLSRPE